MKDEIIEYQTLVFDCDGVVLDSNRVKTAAFYQATLPYGEAAAQAMVNYHIANGGISRYKKFAYFLERIAPEASAAQQGLSLDELLRAYAGYVGEGLLSCPVCQPKHEPTDFEITYKSGCLGERNAKANHSS